MADTSRLLHKVALAAAALALTAPLLGAQPASAATKDKLPSRFKVDDKTYQFAFRSNALTVIILDTPTYNNLRGVRALNARSTASALQSVYETAKTAALEYGGHRIVGNAGMFTFKVTKELGYSYIIECSGGFRYAHFGEFSSINWENHATTFMCPPTNP